MGDSPLRYRSAWLNVEILVAMEINVQDFSVVVSTVSPEGIVSLNNFSFFNFLSSNPQFPVFSSMPRMSGKTRERILHNITEKPEMVISFFTPGVKEASVRLVCKVIKTKPLGSNGCAGMLVICEVADDVQFSSHSIPVNTGREKNPGDLYLVIARQEKCHDIGIENLPFFIRNLPTIRECDLARLASLESLPRFEPGFTDQRINSIIRYCRHSKELLHKELLEYAIELLNLNQIQNAWQVLGKLQPLNNSMQTTHFEFNMKQDYDKYTAEDKTVWQTLYEQQVDQISKFASQAYIDGMQLCNFSKDIPKIDELNKILLSATGWRIEIVPGLIDNHSFFKLLSEKKFPASTWLRKMESLDYLEEPDMFHDVLGHAPLLTNTDFCEFLVALARVALKFIEDDYAIELISRLYWYSVEFGLIIEGEELKIYGGGILSSRTETYFSIHDDKPLWIPFDPSTILDTPYIKDKFQEQYFVIDSYRTLFESVDELESLLPWKKCLATPLTVR